MNYHTKFMHKLADRIEAVTPITLSVYSDLEQLAELIAKNAEIQSRILNEVAMGVAIFNRRHGSTLTEQDIKDAAVEAYVGLA